MYAELPGAQHAFDVFPSIRCAHVVRAIDRYLHWHWNTWRGDRVPCDESPDDGGPAGPTPEPPPLSPPSEPGRSSADVQPQAAQESGSPPSGDVPTVGRVVPWSVSARS